jgi:hypothetical protein
MGIGAFGIDPASKFATELQSLEIWRKAHRGDGAPPTVGNTAIITGSGQLSGRVARGSTFRKTACGSAFRLLSFHTVQGWRPAHLVPTNSSCR